MRRALVVGLLVCAAPALAAAQADPKVQLAAATGEVARLDLRFTSRDTMRELAQLADQRDVTLAWPLGAHGEVAFVEDLDGSGLLARVTHLEVSCDGCVERLARARHGRALRVLRAAGCASDSHLDYWHNPCVWLSARAARALAGARALPALVELDTSARGPALAALLRGRFARRLRTLHVMTTPQGMAAIGAAPALVRLERLSISAPEADARAVTSLVTSPHLRRRLHTLTFASSDSEGERTLWGPGMRALARHMRLRAVRNLDLSSNYVGDVGLRPLVHARWLDQLERLDLVHTGLEDGTGADARAALDARGPWPALRVLAISHRGSGFPPLLPSFGLRIDDGGDGLQLHRAP